MFVILVYDVNEKRVAKALKKCRKYLTWVQNSVFEGNISEATLKRLILELEKVLDLSEDSVIIYKFQNKWYSERQIIGIEKNPVDFIT